MALLIRPIRFATACEFIDKHHRHHRAPVGWLFGVGCYDDARLCGVAVCGRPVSRHRDDGETAEITRLCTDGTPHAASKLYSACRRICQAMGYRRLGTYILVSETGVSLRAAGWHYVYTNRGGSWDCPSRPRDDKHPTDQKQLWEVSLGN